MSISDPKIGSTDTTAANGRAVLQNFAVPPTLPEPGSSTPAPSVGPRSISDRELALVQVCTDFICSCAALPLALLLLSMLSSVATNSLHVFRSNVTSDSLLPLCVVVAMALGGTYRVTHRRLQPSAFLEVRDLSFGVGSGCVLALAIGAFLHAAIHMTEPIATQLVFAVIVSVVVISLGRIVTRYFLHALTTTRVLVVGSGKLANRIMMSVRQDPGMTLVGRAVEGTESESGTLGGVADLPRLCQELGVHRVLVAAPGNISDEALNTYRRLQESIHIAMIPEYFELVSWRSRLTDLAGMPFLEIARPHLSVWDQFMKRVFDLCISSFFLALTSPLFLVIAIAIKLTSPGPVFFRQTRLGRGQLPFTITKFRTMTVGTEMTHPSFLEEESDDDPSLPLHQVRKKSDETMRITKIGAFLRKTSIDEIPQFINVFRGDMSVVGPRPFIPSESGVIGWGTRRFDVRPGITGLWQVSGRNDLTRTDLVQLDYLYVASWSLWWDLKIMWDTPKTMARGTGAY
ncbi:MAG TPA: sugar transferase [Acidimicrobiales bacterium]|jgi:exopolysaccharide biosynthesis polyprenyl glycosylphosphotransferase|nr:sugar transferase [Acidimicrobiales bacterium]